MRVTSCPLGHISSLKGPPLYRVHRPQIHDFHSLPRYCYAITLARAVTNLLSAQLQEVADFEVVVVLPFFCFFCWSCLFLLTGSPGRLLFFYVKPLHYIAPRKSVFPATVGHFDRCVLGHPCALWSPYWYFSYLCCRMSQTFSGQFVVCLALFFHTSFLL